MRKTWFIEYPTTKLLIFQRWINGNSTIPPLTRRNLIILHIVPNNLSVREGKGDEERKFNYHPRMRKREEEIFFSLQSSK